MKDYNDFAADADYAPRKHCVPHCCDFCGKTIAPRVLHKSGHELCFDCQEELEEEESA